MLTGRTAASVRNLGMRWLNMLSVILFRFLNRAVFVRLLPPEYLGLSGLFTQLLAVLSLAELGVGGAITYRLYRPLAEGDQEEICGLAGLYRRIYAGLGLFVLGAGALLTPLLPWLIHDMPRLPGLRLYYLMFVAQASLSYFWAYKGALFAADQKNYVPVFCNMLTNVAATLIQIGLLAATGSYLLYLTAMVMGTLANNLLLSALADRAYPFLRTRGRHLPRQTIREIFRYTRATLAQKLGQVVVDSTDHLVIAKFCGLVPLGGYTNYTMLSVTLRKLLQGIFQSVGASVGDLGASGTPEHQYQIFDSLWLLGYWGFSFGACGLLCVASPLVELCFGKSYVLEPVIPLLLAVSFFITGQREAALSFLSGLGLLDRKRYIPLLEAAVNLLLSVVLAVPLGIPGVLLGTIGGGLIPLVLQPMVLFRAWFHRPLGPYLFRLLWTGGLAGGEWLLAWRLCLLYQGPVLPTLLWRCLICTVVVNGVNLLVFFRSPAFAYYRRLFRRIKR